MHDGVSSQDGQKNGQNAQFNLDDFNLNTDETSWEVPTHRDIGSKAIFSSDTISDQLLDQPLDRSSEQAQTSPTDMDRELVPMPEITPAPEFPVAPEFTSDSASNSQDFGPAVFSRATVSDQSAISNQSMPSAYNLKTTSKLNRDGVATVNKAITKFSQDGNVADFYEEIRGENGMLATNLQQSYGRKIGEQE